MPPARITSRSAMLSAPAAMPAMIEVSFGVGLAAPARIRSSVKRTCFVQQPAQTGLVGQFHHRDQPGARHEVLLIEHRAVFTPGMGCSHWKCPFELLP